MKTNIQRQNAKQALEDGFVRISKASLRRLKIEAARTGQSMWDIAERAILRYLGPAKAGQ